MFIDIIVGVVIFISAVISFIRGFIREVLTIGGVVGGLAAAYFFGPAASPMFRGWFGIEEGVEAGKLMGIIPYTILSDGLAYVSIFLLVVIVISIASHFLAEGLKSMGMGAIDRTFGVIFGIVRGVLLLGLFYLPFYLFMPQEDKEGFFADSRTYIYLDYTAGFLANFVPEGAKEAAEDSAQQLEETITTQQKLQDLNLLQQEGQEDVEGEGESGEGYQQPFRDNLNELFREHQMEDNTNE